MHIQSQKGLEFYLGNPRIDTSKKYKTIRIFTDSNRESKGIKFRILYNVVHYQIEIEENIIF
jgi:hypothetical protein